MAVVLFMVGVGVVVVLLILLLGRRRGGFIDVAMSLMARTRPRGIRVFFGGLVMVRDTIVSRKNHQ